jgi:hypothetical protein
MKKTLTLRERFIINYSARLSVKVRRYAEMNGIGVHEIEAETVKTFLLDALSATIGSPFQPEIDRMSDRSWTGFLRTIVRRVEDSNHIRRDYWAAKI